jgi:hypothetical protein
VATNTSTPKVYAAIAGVMADLAKAGIAKDRANQAQGYKFRGIDDVYNALAPVLSAHGLLMLPRVIGREVVERTNNKGTALFYVTVDVEFSLVCAEDGSAHVIRTCGEAMDSGDKASNKAMSAAYKYAAMQAFCIPTEGDNDADATTHEVAPRKDYGPGPEGKDWWGCEGPGPSAYSAKKEGLADVFESWREQIAELPSAAGWTEWCRAHSDAVGKMPRIWRVQLRNEAEEKATELGVDFNARRAA